MARKLVFDRTIWINGSDKLVTVPDGELWKVGYGSIAGGYKFLSGIYFSGQSSIGRIISGGVDIKLSNDEVLCGLAFKVVEE